MEKKPLTISIDLTEDQFKKFLKTRTLKIQKIYEIERRLKNGNTNKRKHRTSKCN